MSGAIQDLPEAKLGVASQSPRAPPPTNPFCLAPPFPKTKTKDKSPFLHRRVSQPPFLIDITELAIYIKTTFH